MDYRQLPDNGHIPTIAEQHDNRWGVYCVACSQTAEDYVWPCREGVTWDVPALLVAADALAAAREELAEAKREEERYRQEVRDSATTAGRALRELDALKVQYAGIQIERDLANEQLRGWRKRAAEQRTVCAAAPQPTCSCKVQPFLAPPRIVHLSTCELKAAAPQDDEWFTTPCVAAELGVAHPAHPLGKPEVRIACAGAVPGDGEQAAATSHGWTSHGYACCGKAKTGERPNARARCMGNPRCAKCKAEAERIHATLPTSGQA
jgi:hypothetical protein